MSETEKPSCVEPSQGPILPVEGKSSGNQSETNKKEIKRMAPLVGSPAIDFETNAYYEGVFKNFKLSEFKGKWILLCFYPGDFTFV
jgi:peroxiredoxin (alkyl hydroperoxide reductase subunit C)